MKLISVYFLLILTVCPPLYWLLPTGNIKKTVLFILSAAIVTFFFPTSSLILGITGLLIFLILKYAHRKLKFIAVLLPILGFVAFKFLSGNLPSFMAIVGMSFFTLKLIHFAADHINGSIENINLFHFLFYLYFFPVFTAGPIIRYEEFMENVNLTSQTPEFSQIKKGVRRIALGFLKKLVLLLPFFVQNEQHLRTGTITTPGGMALAIVAYAFFIYWDFSSYTDIAIGTSLLFNYKVPENFNLPYFKKNISLFWQSWHMTLTRWLQSYIFVPLSRIFIGQSSPAIVMLGTGFAQVLTMTICGFWHGSNLNYLVWGAWHGFGLFMHALFKSFLKTLPAKKRLTQPWLTVPWTLLTFIYVCVGWFFFCAPLSVAFRNISVLLGMK